MSDNAGGENDDPPHTRSKVGRVIVEYGLEELGEELERYWRGDGVKRRSLRDLATHFNQHILRAAMVEAGQNPLEGEPANIYRLLTSDDVTSGTRTNVERRLEREGIDIESLRDDFVSHQAIHTYLTDYCGVTLEDQMKGEPVDNAINRIQQLNARSKAVSESAIAGLLNQDEIYIGEHNVTIDAQVVCRDCNSQYDLVQFLQQGSCSCEPN